MNQIFQINILNVLHDVRQVMQITNVWVSLLQDIYTEHNIYLNTDMMLKARFISTAGSIN